MDEEYRAVINRFFGLYRELQKSSNLTMHCSFSAYSDGIIEVWEGKGSEKICICRVEEKEDIACYKKAMGVLKMHYWEGDMGHVKKAG